MMSFCLYIYPQFANGLNAFNSESDVGWCHRYLSYSPCIWTGMVKSALFHKFAYLKVLQLVSLPLLPLLFTLVTGNGRVQMIKAEDVNAS